MKVGGREANPTKPTDGAHTVGALSSYREIASSRVQSKTVRPEIKTKRKKENKQKQNNKLQKKGSGAW